jgi:hypothetical protein
LNNEANIKIYLKYYKKSQLVVSDDLIYCVQKKEDKDRLYQFIVEKGITIRDDSPLVAGTTQQHIKTWSVRSPEFYQELYLKKPLILETEHYSHIKKNGNWIGKNGEGIIPQYRKSGADILRNALKIMHASYIGYHGYVEDWFADNPDLANELTNRCGYWLFPVSAEISDVAVTSKNMLKMDWLNKGVAPAYNRFSLVLRFKSGKLKKQFDVIIDDARCNQWLPNVIKQEIYSYEISANIRKGDYEMFFKLEDRTSAPSQMIKLGIDSKYIDENGFIPLGKVIIKSSV